MRKEEIIAVNEVLKDSPLRTDEFPLFSAEILELDVHDFKEHYNEDNEVMPPEMHIIVADGVEIGFEIPKDGDVEGLFIWLGDKKLGAIHQDLWSIFHAIESSQKLSRVVIIENPDSVPTFYDSYMKAVFVVTNAEGVEISYDKGRFKSLRALTQDEIDEIDNA